MSTIELEKDFAIEIIETNLAIIKNEIEVILNMWNQNSAEEMIKKTEEGELPEAEIDAISLSNLIEKQSHLEEILRSIEE